VTLVGAGCLALSPVTRAGATVAAPPGPGQGQGHNPPGQQQNPNQQQPPQHQNQQQQTPPQHQNQQNQQPSRQQPPSNNGGRMGANDPHSWHNWDNNWRDDRFRREHSFDSRHERFEDRDHGRFEDRFHIDDFRFRDADFRTDCDDIRAIGSVHELLDFLDGHPALREFFEDHGDLFDFLVHHDSFSDDFDTDCTFIDVF
jgi:hypothetical protein